MPRSFALVLTLLSLGACEDAGVGDIIVEVRTDFLPGVEFDAVRTRVFVDESDTHEREVSFSLTPDLDADAFSAGVRVAESAGLPAGEIRVVVALLDGELVAAEAQIRAELSDSLALTVPITRSCEGVVCPDIGRSACLAGRCVTPECAASAEACDFPALAFDDYGHAFSVAACERLRRCGGPRYDATFEGADCVEILSAGFEDAIGVLLRAAIERGTLSYDGSLGRACTEAAGSLGCESAASSFDLVECYEAFQVVGSADVCHMDLECPPDAFCDTSASCPGQCSPRRLAGEACNDDAMCQFGQTCAGAPSAGGLGACTPVSGTGGPCGGNGAECRADHFCLGSRRLPTPRDGTCQAVETLFIGRPGDACDLRAGPLCASGSSCVSDGADTAGTCRPHPSEPGAACGFSLPDMCPVGEYCEVEAGTFSGTCAPLPRAGEPCAAETIVLRCAHHHRCALDQCVPSGRIGDGCAADIGCVNGSCGGGFCTAPMCSRLL